MWPTELELDGVSIPLAEILADVTIRHGRDSADAQPIASSATITLEPVDRELTASFTVGASMALHVSVDDPPIVGTFKAGERRVGGSTSVRFVGVVTDAELDVDTLTLTAIGPLAGAMRVLLDLTGWPVEPWSARCARVFAAAGVAVRIEPDPDFDPLLEPPVNPDTMTMLLGEYLPSLADAVGAAICDGPDGVIVCQALGSRSSRDARYIILDPSKVQYAPTWTQALDVVNDVTVEYGPDAAVVAARAVDAASVLAYGNRATAIESTRLHAAADATDRAQTVLARNSYPRWSMPNAPLLAPILLSVGDRVQVDELPAASPFPVWTPLLEGWTDRIDGSAWTIELALSDPLESGLALQWRDVPAGVTWEELDPAVEWWQAVELGAILPAAPRAA